ncbi:hypothetical protein [Marinibactrum halimedae]|uniref:Uncharacterized protein n=1 Tax=Marinibactrum halimedae TaxID=1444977 RepID=A0AA37T9U6_9GAMM|nr:hypothetical protein [Marinibactrum halimedae]MCD9458474.1 hypothetical protein [Marinibactrum halimedae]GLS26170.1 hypothetical protein GCM10007877_18850 [Marinibactrum halimedae]
MKRLLKNIHSDVRLSAIFYGVISSLMATVLWSYSWSILTWAGSYSFGWLKGFVDSRYAKAATLESTNYSYFLMIIFFVVIVIGWLEISGRIKKKLKENKQSNPPEEKPLNINSDTPSWASKVFLLVRVMVLFYLLNGLLYIAGEVTVLNVILDFKQHMRIITPYISQEKKDMMISSWSQMRGVDDYNKVYEELLSVAKDNNLTLYRNRTY